MKWYQLTCVFFFKSLWFGSLTVTVFECILSRHLSFMFMYWINMFSLMSGFYAQLIDPKANTQEYDDIYIPQKSFWFVADHSRRYNKT